MTIESEYHRARTLVSDINEHLPVLCDMAKGVRHVTEFGVRNVVSTWAFLEGLRQAGHKAKRKLCCYDKHRSPHVDNAQGAAGREGIAMQFHRESTLNAIIEPTDLLFIDTLHTFAHLRAELCIHADRVRQWIVLHDTDTYGDYDETDKERLIKGRGLSRAIKEFLETGTGRFWAVTEKYENNNGLTILTRI